MSKALLARTFAVLAAAAVGIAATSKSDDLSLKRKPKVGDAAEYAVSAEFQTDQGTIKFNETLAEKVTAVNPDGTFVTSVNGKDVKIDIGGQAIDAPDTTVTEIQTPNGHVKTITSDNAVEAASYRITNLQEFQAPDNAVKVGDEIKYDIPADKTLGTPAVTADYKVVGTEKVKDWDTVKMTFTTAETEGDSKASMSGTLWLSTADGSLVKSDGKWTNVQPQGVPMPLTGKYTTERTK